MSNTSLLSEVNYLQLIVEGACDEFINARQKPSLN